MAMGRTIALLIALIFLGQMYRVGYLLADPGWVDLDLESSQDCRPPRLRRIVMCIVANQKNQANLDLYLVRRYKICHFPLVALYLCIGQNQKNLPICICI